MNEPEVIKKRTANSGSPFFVIAHSLFRAQGGHGDVVVRLVEVRQEENIQKL